MLLHLGICCAAAGIIGTGVAPKPPEVFVYKGQPRKLVGHAHDTWVVGLAFSPDGRLLASAGLDGIVLIWDVAAGKPLRAFRGPGEKAYAVAFSPDGRLLAVAGSDPEVRIYNPETSRLVCRLKGHTDAVTCLAFSPEGKTLASGSYDKTIRLWDVSPGLEWTLLRNRDVGHGKEWALLEGHEGRVTSVSFSPDGKVLASGATAVTTALNQLYANADRVRLWDLSETKFYKWATEPPPRILVGNQRPRTRPTGLSRVEARVLDTLASAVSFSADGRTLAAAASQLIGPWQTERGPDVAGYDMVYLLDGDGRELLRAQARGGKAQCVGGGSIVAAGGGLNGHEEGNRLNAGPVLPDGRLALWDAATGQEVVRFPHDCPTVSITSSMDGRLLATGGGSEIWVYDLREVARNLPGPTAETDLASLWSDLAGEGFPAFRAGWLLTVQPEPAVAFLKSSLSISKQSDVDKYEQAVRRLESEAFADRRAAIAELRSQGLRAEPTLRAWLSEAPSAQARASLISLVDHMRKSPDKESLRIIRAIQVLERIGTQPARDVLEELSRGAPAGLETREASASLGRLERLR